jgi:hypothetical protein
MDMASLIHNTVEMDSNRTLSAYYWLIPGGVKFSKSSISMVLLIDIRYRPIIG